MHYSSLSGRSITARVSHEGRRRFRLARAGVAAVARRIGRRCGHRQLGDSASIRILQPKAKSVIWCFLDGGPSHIDLFDPKPALNKLAGKPLPDSFVRPVTAMGRTAYTDLLACQRKFRQHGQSGTWVSDWYPEIATCVDDIAVVRSCTADGLNHVGSVCQMNTGSVLAGRPSLGSWAFYGLGTENEELPGYVVLLDYPDEPPGGHRNWGTGFMPAAYQGTKFRDGSTPILHLAPPAGVSPARQRREARLRPPAQRAASQAVARTTTSSRPASPPTSWRTACSRPRRRRSISPTKPRARGSSTASTRRKPPTTAATACWPAGWSSAACGSCSSTSAPAASGTRTPTSRATTRSIAANPIGRSPACSRI